jgi:hypothetical protein
MDENEGVVGDVFVSVGMVVPPDVATPAAAVLAADLSFRYLTTRKAPPPTATHPQMGRGPSFFFRPPPLAFDSVGMG